MPGKSRVSYFYDADVGNYYYGESNIEFISSRHAVLVGYRILVVLAVLAGSVAAAELVWNFADGVMGLMALTNLIAIGLLSGLAFRLLKESLEREGWNRLPIDLVAMGGVKEVLMQRWMPELQRVSESQWQ